MILDEVAMSEGKNQRQVDKRLISNLQVSSSFKQDRAPVILQDLVDQVSPTGASIRFYVSF